MHHVITALMFITPLAVIATYAMHSELPDPYNQPRPYVHADQPYASGIDLRKYEEECKNARTFIHSPGAPQQLLCFSDEKCPFKEFNVPWNPLEM